MMKSQSREYKQPAEAKNIKSTSKDIQVEAPQLIILTTQEEEEERRVIILSIRGETLDILPW